MNSDHHEIKQPASNKLKVAGAGFVLVAACVAFYGIAVRIHDKNALVTWTNQQAVPSVRVWHPKVQNKTQTLVLPGTLAAYISAPIYARVDGYLKSWSVDIGARVKSGQLLALIDTPDLDQQLLQAQADLDTARARENLAEISAKRWQALLATDSVSQQEADEKTGDYEAKRAEVKAAMANVERLRAMEAFKRVVAPFDGVVTDRQTDVGALINAGRDTGHTMFIVSDLHKLRLYVGVPQRFVTQIRLGMQVAVRVPEWPGKTFSAQLVNISNAVSDNSGTEQVELSVDNAPGKLLPGYANASFDISGNGNSLLIPASAIAYRKGGLSVALLTPDNHVMFRALNITRDLGQEIEVSSGLSAQDRVIDNPSESLRQGDLVQVAAPQATAAGAGGAS